MAGSIARSGGHPDRRLGLALGAGVPLILRGATPVASWAPSPVLEANPDFLATVAALYRNDPLLARALDDGLRAADMADRVIEGSTIPGDTGGGARANLHLLAKTAGEMLAAADGPRVAVLDVPGWDMPPASYYRYINSSSLGLHRQQSPSHRRRQKTLPGRG
jgi:uncharacterized protein (DUF1501 family)